MTEHEHTSSYYHMGLCMTCGKEHPNVKGLGLTVKEKGKVEDEKWNGVCICVKHRKHKHCHNDCECNTDEVSGQ